jgi:hypothetical protein
VYRTSRSFAGKRPHRRTTKSGGRKPPVDYENALATTIPQYAEDCRRRTGEPHCNRSSQNHGGLVAVCDSPCLCVVEPRRADTRRSCAHAFVHRACRYFSADRLRAPGAAGVSQPWCTIRSCVVNVITPRKPIAIAGAIPVPRRVDGSRLLMRQSVFAEHCSLCPASAAGYRPTAG